VNGPGGVTTSGDDQRNSGRTSRMVEPAGSLSVSSLAQAGTASSVSNRARAAAESADTAPTSTNRPTAPCCGVTRVTLVSSRVVSSTIVVSAVSRATRSR